MTPVVARGIQPNADSQPYWDAAAHGELIYQLCESCGKAQFYPRGRCVQCGGSVLKWLTSMGRGRIYAITEVHVGQAGYNDGAPYHLALIELDEGFRIMTNICGSRKDVTIDRRGHIIFEARHQYKLPQFVIDESA